jgi:hypothetical protein
MMKSTSLLVAFLAISGVLADVTPSNAVVYCKTAGVPRGCIARPAGAAVVHPVTTRPVVYCKTVGVPKGCVMR